MGVTPPYIDPRYGHHGSLRRLAIGLAEAGNSHFFAISGRTDLRKGVSEAKFDPEADFDVKKSLRPPKSAENHEKPKKNHEKPKKIAKKKSKKQFFFELFFSIRNRLKRVLATFCRSKTARKLRTTQKIAKILRKFAKTFAKNFREADILLNFVLSLFAKCCARLE